MDHSGDEGAQSRGRANGLTGRGGNMGLKAWGEAGEFITLCRTEDKEARGGARELDGVSSRGEAEELDDSSRDGGSRGLDGTIRGDHLVMQEYWRRMVSGQDRSTQTAKSLTADKPFGRFFDQKTWSLNALNCHSFYYEGVLSDVE